MTAETLKLAAPDDKLHKEAPQLVAVLKEMKDGLDAVTRKVQTLTAKVRANEYPTADGISYLETKHLLLLSYCQSLVYYLLRKAKGLSIESHPVVNSLIEIRLFLEKIRPIDKKLDYQVQKLTRAAANDVEKEPTNGKDEGAQKSEDLLRYRPNPDMLVPKIVQTDEDDGGKYRPPKIAPTTIEDDKMTRLERNARRKSEDMLRRAKDNEFTRQMINDMEDRPLEVRETIGTESRELARFRQKYEERERHEEEIFNRAPITKAEKKKMKHLLKSRNGLLGLTESFYDEIKSLPLGDNAEEQSASGIGSNSNMERRHKKRKKR